MKKSAIMKMSFKKPEVRGSLNLFQISFERFIMVSSWFQGHGWRVVMGLLWVVVCGLSLCSGNSGGSEAAESYRSPSSFLWKIQSKPPSYFFGTIHVPYTRVWDAVPRNAKQAFKVSNPKTIRPRWFSHFEGGTNVDVLHLGGEILWENARNCAKMYPWKDPSVRHQWDNSRDWLNRPCSYIFINKQ